MHFYIKNIHIPNMLLTDIILDLFILTCGMSSPYWMVCLWCSSRGLLHNTSLNVSDLCGPLQSNNDDNDYNGDYNYKYNCKNKTSKPNIIWNFEI